MTILLLGANGQVGHALRKTLAPLGALVLATRDGRLADGSACEAADLARPQALSALIARIAPQVVVNAAAYTAVDRAEAEPEAAFAANAVAPEAIARACAEHGAWLLHYSTDYVFDGSATCPYREHDPTAPLGVYGASKLAGEQAIAGSGARHLILRTAWIYALHGQNFLRTMLRLAAERDELRVVDDQHGSPTPAWLVAETSARILAHGPVASGVRHLVALGDTTWHGFAQAIVDRAHATGLLPRRPRVVAVGSADFPTVAQRPAYSVLDTRQLAGEYDLVLPHWRDALERTLPGR